ncbi:MAG: enoyl-CoA hydratase [Pseudomonadota bacterium]
MQDAAGGPPEAGAEAIVTRAISGAVATVTLNRARARNALSEAMLAELTAALRAVEATPGVRVAILRAEGPAFCAGHDLKEMTAFRAEADGGRAGFARTFAACATLMKTIVGLRQPVIAEVGGVATAAGCQLVATCDLAVAGESARFGTPGVDIGLFCSTPMVALSRNVSRKHAMEMLLTGELQSAARAREIGLVNRVVADAALAEETRALAEKIAAKSPKAVKIGKPAFYAQAQMTLEEAYAYTSEVMTENMLAADAVEGVGAFIEKRPPSWPDDAPEES